MRAASLLWFAPAVLLCGAAASGQAKPQPHYAITGVLVSSVDGSPIPHGHLVAVLSGNRRNAGRRFPSPDNGVDTDTQGRFAISLPSGGLWDLVADAHGFSRQSYEQHEQFSTAVVLSSAVPVMDIRFVLRPEAEITGVVLDEAGEPVRRAQVSLHMMHPPGPDHSQPAMTTRAGTQTDDRGEYEFAGLPAGNYRISVQAQPWYAVAAGQGHSISDDAPSPDPSLDFTYPLTWFPGTEDEDAAQTLTLRAGDNTEADFHLLPVASVHLLISPPPNPSASGITRGIPFIPMIQRIGPGANGFVQVTYNRNAQGQIDVGGLAPGLYRVRLGQPGEETRTDVIRVTGGSAQTISLDSATNEARVTVHLDGLPDEETRSVQISLLDPASARSAVPFDGGFQFRGGFSRLPNTAGGGSGLRGSRSAGGRASSQNEDRVIEVPPGQYEVVLQRRPDLYLTGITAKGAQTTGRLVTLPAGDSSLTVHVASGRTTLTGIATFEGKPSVGAMVMLVPATLGEPGAIAIVRRDQSNTDGSFDLPEVIPGQYILIAVNNGWDINWSDASTLRRYLTQGVPVDLTPGHDVKVDIAAQTP